MARVKDNPITQGLSGKLGKRFFFRHLRNGTTLLCTVPDFSDRVFSTGQLTHQSRFQQASAYAKTAAKTIPLYAELAPARDTKPYNLALSDWFHAPVIHQITWQNDLIGVQATDNVQVTRLLITISDEHGNTLEHGEAVLAAEDWWEYKPAVQGSLLAQAFDLPGNTTKKEMSLRAE